MSDHEERDPTDLTFGSSPFGVCALAALLAGLAFGFALTRGDLGFWLVGLGALILLGYPWYGHGGSLGDLRATGDRRSERGRRQGASSGSTSRSIATR